MKILQSSIFRAICAIIIGILLIKYPDKTITGITICIGILFILPGVFSVATYLSARKNARPEQLLDANGKIISGGNPSLPIAGLGSIILGLFLTLMPSTFVSLLMYLLGAIIILGAINQFIMLVNMKKISDISWAFYLAPSIILLTGLFVLIYPIESASLPLIIIGCCCIVYGVSECVNAYKDYKLRKENISL